MCCPCGHGSGWVCVACAATAVARLGVRCPYSHGSGWVCVTRAATAVARLGVRCLCGHGGGWVSVARVATAVAGCASPVQPRRWLALPVRPRRWLGTGCALPVRPRRWLGVRIAPTVHGAWAPVRRRGFGRTGRMAAAVSPWCAIMAGFGCLWWCNWYGGALLHGMVW